MDQCGILIISHTPLGQSFLSVIEHVIGNVPEHVKALDIVADMESDHGVEEALHIMEELDEGEGVLIICDSKGASPGNIAHRLHTLYPHSSLIYGLSLPMLLRAINYRARNHHEVAEAAIIGAQRGILEEGSLHA